MSISLSIVMYVFCFANDIEMILMSFRRTLISSIVMFYWFRINNFAKSDGIVTVRKHPSLKSFGPSVFQHVFPTDVTLLSVSIFKGAVHTSSAHSSQLVKACQIKQYSPNVKFAATDL